MKKISQLSAASLAFLVSVVLFIVSLGISGIVIPFLKSGNAVYIALTLATIFPLGLGFMVYMLITKQSLKEFWGQRVSAEQIALSAFLAPFTYLVIILVQSLWISLLSLIGIPPMPDGMPVIDTTGTFLLALLSVAITPAFFEEVIFRGMLQGSLITRKRSNIAIVITATLFMLMHGALQSMPYTFLLGLIIGYLCYRSGSIWPPIVFHFSNNAIAVITKYLTNNIEMPTDMDQMMVSGGLLEWLPLVFLALVGGGVSFLLLYIFNKVTPTRKVTAIKDYRPLRTMEWLPLLLGALALLAVLFFTTVTAILIPVQG